MYEKKRSAYLFHLLLLSPSSQLLLDIQFLFVQIFNIYILIFRIIFMFVVILVPGMVDSVLTIHLFASFFIHQRKAEVKKNLKNYIPSSYKFKSVTFILNCSMSRYKDS